MFKLNLLPSSFRNREFWKVALCFGMTMGIADQWSSILDVDVTDLVDSEVWHPALSSVLALCHCK